MTLLDLTLPTPAENLACDEALLDWGDEAGGEVLRFWEPAAHFVVAGYANKLATEVNQPGCAAEGIPILRRCSGGGTVLQGPGCLNFALVLQIREAGPLGSLSGTNRFVMQRHREAMAALLGRPVAVCGHTDLALEGRKFSGNAQRRKHRALLFHGTFLCRFDLSLLGRFLHLPSQQPDYRRDRPHLEFVMNLGLDAEALKGALRKTWQAREVFSALPEAAIDRLVRERYASPAWTFKF